MVVTTIVITSLLFGANPAPSKKVFPDLFEACKCQYTDEQQRKKSLAYHLFVPRSLGPNERCPMLVWPVFGAWIKLALDDLDNIDKYRFFVLVVTSHEGFDKILQEVVGKYQVDQNRVYLSGASRGGWVCWNIAMRYPDLVAAVAPLGAPRADASLGNKLINIPIWAFHSRDETYVPRAGTEEMVASIGSAGGNVHLALIPSKSHDCWTTAFKQYNILEWLMCQRRGARICWVPPGTQPWKWGHVLTVPFVFSAILVLWWLLERTRRIRKRRRTAAFQEFLNSQKIDINAPIW